MKNVLDTLIDQYWRDQHQFLDQKLTIWNQRKIKEDQAKQKLMDMAEKENRIIPWKDEETFQDKSDKPLPLSNRNKINTACSSRKIPPSKPCTQSSISQLKKIKKQLQSPIKLQRQIDTNNRPQAFSIRINQKNYLSGLNFPKKQFRVVDLFKRHDDNIERKIIHSAYQPFRKSEEKMSSTTTSKFSKVSFQNLVPNTRYSSILKNTNSLTKKEILQEKIRDRLQLRKKKSRQMSRIKQALCKRSQSCKLKFSMPKLSQNNYEFCHFLKIKKI